MINLSKPETYTREVFLQRFRHGISQERRSRQKPDLGNPERKFLIFAQGRTGSTLLTSLLTSHPQICCDEEIFYYPKLLPYAYAERLARGSGAMAYGFKVKIYQIPGLLGRRVSRFLDRFESMGYRLIYLERKDIVQHSFSSYFAMKSKSYHFRESDGQRDVSFRIAPEEFLRLCENRAVWLHEEARHLKGRNYLHITYEDDLMQAEEGWAALSDKIVPFLDVTPQVLSTPLRKSVQNPPSTYLENVDEIHAALKASDFSQYADSLYRGLS